MNFECKTLKTINLIFLAFNEDCIHEGDILLSSNFITIIPFNWCIRGFSINPIRYILIINRFKSFSSNKYYTWQKQKKNRF
jgi:hypothetical protein